MRNSPKDSGSPLESNSESSFSGVPLSSSEDEVSLPKSKARRQPKEPKVLSVYIPGHHRSLIGHQEERVYLAKRLELSRLPCSLSELRRCRKALSFCNYVAFELCPLYENPSNPNWDYTKKILNLVKSTFQIRNMLDTVKFKYSCYSPYLLLLVARYI